MAVARRVLLVVALLAVVVGLLLLVRAGAAAREQAWVDGCVADGGWVATTPADTANPLVVHTGHPVLSCVSETGVVVSVRD
ncbi:hypothetical protein [Microlunatus flavus]|uniref:Uncharacterized protein n=1 Tax=Microlunatus flavus TaxID=1036181 RepID=A0A1H9CAC5_9ACTN|nr:hypothetical protein [Microlunatus flavus]SEP98112.1 hypothetical protein SAMN05421756_102132 [Microlunatus flavus]